MLGFSLFSQAWFTSFPGNCIDVSLDQYLTSRGKKKKKMGNPKLGPKLGFLVFPQVCIIIVFLDIARYCSLDQCLASSGAETSKESYVAPS